MKILVLDFGGSAVKYSVMGDDARIYEEGSREAPLESKEQYLDFIQNIYEEYKNQVDGVSISMPGFVDANTGDLPSAGVYVKMAGSNVYDDLKGRLDVPFWMENDGKCAALSEFWHGSMEGIKDGVVVILGTGLAGGVVLDGKIRRGFHNVCGEFSFLGMDPKGLSIDIPGGSCTMSGLTLKATNALGIDMKKCSYYYMAQVMHMEQKPLSLLNDEPRFQKGIDGILFFELLEEKNEIIEKIYDEFVSNICSLLMTIQCTIDPEQIALGGPVFKQERLMGDIKAKLETSVAPIKIKVVQCMRTGNTNQYGAAYNYFTREKK